MTTPLALRTHADNDLDLEGAIADGNSARRGNALSNKLTSVLSSSYADNEIRDALRLFDTRYGQIDVNRDFDLKYEAQKQVIETNARIIDDFAKVAKVDRLYMCKDRN